MSWFAHCLKDNIVVVFAQWKLWLISPCGLEVRVRREKLPDTPPTLRVKHPTRKWLWLLGIWQAHSSLIAQFPSFVLRPHYDLIDTVFNTITTCNKCPINTGFNPLLSTMHFSAFQTAISCVRLRSASHAWSHSLLRRNISIFAGKMCFKSSGNTVAQKFSSVLSFESEGLLLTQETLD